VNWPIEFPLAMFEMSFLLPHLVREGRGRLDTYFTRVYNPVWTNPDGFSWIEMLKDEQRVGLHVALTPTWSETSYFADYVLPVGLGGERHDVHSYEQYDGQWIGFRQPVLRTARERMGVEGADTLTANPGEVWEENELWIELSWRIDPDGSMGIRQWFESRQRPGEKLTVDEYYGWMFENSVPGLPDRAAAENLTPLEYMRRHGAFEIRRGIGPTYEQPVPQSELIDVQVDRHGRAFTRADRPVSPNIVPQPAPDGDAEGRRPVGVLRDGHIVRGFPTPSGRLEFFSQTLADWGWPEHAIPGYIRSHVHPDHMEPDQMPLIATFRLPVHIHTRSGNSKWLDEIAHTNPLWLHPRDAAPLDVATGDLVRVETRIGHYVVKAWVTEGIRPGVVACSHHMGRWRLSEIGQRQITALASLSNEDTSWLLRRESGPAPFASDDPDTGRIWWSEGGVHQNLAFPVQPDPISGMHCWHQAVRVKRAEPGDRQGDVAVDTAKSREAYAQWLELARPADRVSPDGTRRPHWLMRPLRPARDAYRIERVSAAAPDR
jgi:anaerobic selenocysteine-containing dehydrogenase